VKSRLSKSFIMSLIILMGILQTYSFSNVGNTSESSLGDDNEELVVNDSNLRSELVYKGIQAISNMAILGPDDILVLEKNNGTVKRITNGTMQLGPLIDLNVFHSEETGDGGLLGIAAASNISGPRYVFLYFTAVPKLYQQDIETTEEMAAVNETFGYTKECNCVYRYELANNKLINPTPILELPANPGKVHYGGEILLGPDGYLYVSVGEIAGNVLASTRTKAQNYQDGPNPDGRAGILRVTQDGRVVNGLGILGDEYPLDMYYAYGIRNSFGMDFDPLTGNLWNTDNGPDYGDEINLISPGFNGGAVYVFGTSSRFGEHSDNLEGRSPLLDSYDDENNDTNDEFDLRRLVDFDGRGKYSDPKFTWETPVGPTALQFLDSDKYGAEYENDMFVGDINLESIYHFDLDEQEDRTELSLDGPLGDKVANSPDETDSIVFASGSGGITDMQMGPDGYLYVLSTRNPYAPPGEGTIYKIVPK